MIKFASAECPCSAGADRSSPSNTYICRCYPNPMIKSVGFLPPVKAAGAIPQADLRYWGEVNDAVERAVANLEPEDQARAAEGTTGVLGNCGHEIRKGSNGVMVEIGKKCFTCLKADDMRKLGTICAGPPPMPWSKGTEPFPREAKQSVRKSASVTSHEVETAMTKARLPQDVTFWSAPDGKQATAYYGDWHSQDVVDAGNKLGRKLFSAWEDPDDSEIGRPEWAIQANGSNTKPEDMIHDCRHNHCPDCGDVTNYCKDGTDGKHEPKKVTKSRCYSCRNGVGVIKGAAITNIGKDQDLEEETGTLQPKLRKARKDTDTDATQAERDAGNYKKGRINIRGLHIAIENPKNSIRSGTSQDGKPWRSVLSVDYGYFTRGGQGSAPIAVDGDEIDVFIGPELDSDFVVAVDQYFNGRYDETKFIICCRDQKHGEDIYLANYQKGWKLGPVSTLTLPQLKEWLKNGKHGQPFKGQMLKSAADTLLPPRMAKNPATWSPYSAGGMGLAGGAVGGGAGALAGLLKTLLDKEDDDVVSGLGKIMAGAGIGGTVGGLGGAAYGKGLNSAVAKKLSGTFSSLPRHPLADEENASRAVAAAKLPIRDTLRSIFALTKEKREAANKTLSQNASNVNSGNAALANLLHNPGSWDSILTILAASRLGDRPIPGRA